MIRVPQFLFHIPHSGRMLTYTELEQRMKKRNVPAVVEVKEVLGPQTGKRIGSFPPSVALLKFK